MFFMYLRVTLFVLIVFCSKQYLS